jgi:hypothetical protein
MRRDAVWQISLIAHRGRPPVLVRAQQSMPVGGYLSGRPPADPLLAEFRRGLAEIGFVERRNMMIEYHWLEAHYDRVQEMVADLVRRSEVTRKIVEIVFATKSRLIRITGTTGAVIRVRGGHHEKLTPSDCHATTSIASSRKRPAAPENAFVWSAPTPSSAAGSGRCRASDHVPNCERAILSNTVRSVDCLLCSQSENIVARLMGQWLSERLGQPFVIENRPGAGAYNLRGPGRERDGDAIEWADQMLRTLDPPAPQGRLGLPSARGRGNERAEFAQSIGK